MKGVTLHSSLVQVRQKTPIRSSDVIEAFQLVICDRISGDGVAGFVNAGKLLTAWPDPDMTSWTGSCKLPNSRSVIIMDSNSTALWL